MRALILLYLFLAPAFALLAFPKLAPPYDTIDWSDYSQWPMTLERNGMTYLINVGGGGGCIHYGGPAGEKPDNETIKKWGSYYACYQLEEKLTEDNYYYHTYGPEISWNRQHEIYRRTFHDGKGARRSYDKKGRAFYKEWHFKNGHSRGYYDLFGRIVLEYRTTITPEKKYIREHYRYRKLCTQSEFDFTKQLINEKFDLYELPYSVK